MDTDLRPLVVDLDGTLLRSDLLVESAFAYLRQKPFAPNLLLALARGKASLKAEIAADVDMDCSVLPYDEQVLALIRQHRADGGRVYLASASDERYVRAVADHLKQFDGCFASDGTVNMAGEAKKRALVEAFGEGGFDYVGNDAADLPAWRSSRRRYATRVSRPVSRELSAMSPAGVILTGTDDAVAGWLSLLRVRQWAKNALVFVPLVTAHRFDMAALLCSLAAFIAFSLVASAVYIVNDVVDLRSDRNHPTKRRRALASGRLPIKTAIAAAPLLILVGCSLALATSPSLAAVVAGYLALTTAYTFSLKRKMMIDVIVLAALYTLRVIGGAAAISVVVSFWLLAFSMFIFTALALVKRYTELTMRIDQQLVDSTDRNYRKSDIGIVAALAAASGFNAVTVLALYISSDAVRTLYRTPEALWLLCPIIMYWLGRALMLADRRQMDDDPIAFALTDRNSYAVLALITIALLLAS